jgi:hypothetical protein
LGDFLGLPGPSTRPGQGGGVQRPGGGRPNRPADRPDFGTRPTRPGQGGSGTLRPGIDRPIRPRPDNGLPNRRPGQRPNINIDNSRINGIQNNWRQAINRPANLPVNGQWNDWGNHIRDNYHGDYDRPWFNDDWWHDHSDCGGWWHDYHDHNHLDWSYWWAVPTWGAMTDWVSGDWSEPYYYDYGTSVVYEDNSVYVNETEVATAEEYSETAFTQADPGWTKTADPSQTEWMGLGVFVLSKNEQESNPTRTLQLAVSKEGYISGVYYNESKDDARDVIGSVDRQTQRACWQIEGSPDIVFDTGIYNLTQDSAPVLVHFGTSETETYLLVRLADESAAPAQSATALP